MASKYTKAFNHLDREVVEVDFKFNLSSAAAVVAGTLVGYGITSVVKNGTGTYDITLDDTWPTLLSAQFTVLGATAVDLVPQIVSETVSSTKIIKIRTLTGATATDTGVAVTIFASLKLKNTSF